MPSNRLQHPLHGHMMLPLKEARIHHLQLAQCFGEEAQECFSSEAFQEDLRIHHGVPRLIAECRK